jgi:short-subunit dehydrogenase
MIDYSSKTAMVTGAASGIGLALAQALSKRGARVILVDRNEARLAEAARAIPASESLVTDLSVPTQANALVGDAFERFGHIDLICSNAGIGRGGGPVTIREQLDASVTQLFEVNAFAALRIAQAYAARLEKSGEAGRLMVTGSEHSLSLPPRTRGNRMALYGATKHALLIMAEWMREELAGRTPIDLHILLPGMTYTAMIARVLANPADAPPEAGLIMPDRCADIALRGMDLGLFYIPTHAHVASDMRVRLNAVASAIDLLGLAAPVH